MIKTVVNILQSLTMETDPIEEMINTDTSKYNEEVSDINIIKKELAEIKEVMDEIMSDNTSIIYTQDTQTTQIENFNTILRKQQELLVQYNKLLTNLIVERNLQNIPVCLSLISKTAKIPEKATNGSGGYDIFAAENVSIPNNGKYTKVFTGLKMKIPSSYYGKISCLSGLAYKDQIYAFHDTIDSDNDKEVFVLLKNKSESPYEVKIGDKICQILFIKINSNVAVEISPGLNITIPHLGFGSIGK